jgi:opacity protein-like surface antigen
MKKNNIGNKMKKLVILLFTFSLLSFQSVKSEEFYIEGHLNYNQVDDVDTTTITDTVAGVDIVGKLTNEYDSDIGLGFEVGVTNDGSNIRFGLSYSESKIELKKLTGSGTVTDGTTTVNFAVSATKADLASVGLSYDNDVKSYSLNAYYDFKTNRTFTPYVGVGLGQADIENANDKEVSKSLYLGGRHSVNDQMYVGLKGAYTMIDGPTDKLGLSYDDITHKSVSLIVGYNF